jgi:hypothetical protein
MFILALIASQGFDMFGFWTTLLWALSALSATVGLYIYRSGEYGFIYYVGIFYLFLSICIMVNFRSHATAGRLLADIYTFTIGPFHALAWISNRILTFLTKGALPSLVPSPWSVINYKPASLKSWDIIQDKRADRWRRIKRRITDSQRG